MCRLLLVGASSISSCPKSWVANRYATREGALMVLTLRGAGRGEEKGGETLARDESRVKAPRRWPACRDPRIDIVAPGYALAGIENMISAEYQFAVNQYREIRNAARRRDGTGRRAGRWTRAKAAARGRTALSDIFVTVAPTNIRQVAIILHSIGARSPDEINAHTFSIRALRPVLSGREEG